MGLPPALRTNVDYIFVCKEPKKSNRKKLYEQYCGIFPDYEMFEKVLTETTNDYGCLVIDNTSTSEKIEDQVFWYKAELHTGGFRMCYPQLWEHQEKLTKLKADASESDDENKDDDEEDGDPLKRFMESKRKFNINVKKLPNS
jgi:hypothetical protein